jgi:hypothetical protein
MRVCARMLRPTSILHTLGLHSRGDAAPEQPDGTLVAATLHLAGHLSRPRDLQELSAYSPASPAAPLYPKPSLGRCSLLATDCTTVALSCAPQRQCAACWWSRCAALRACASLRCNRHPSSRTGSTSMRRWARVVRDRHDALVASPASASSCRMVNAARRTHAACARPSVGGMDAASVSRPERTGSRARGELSTAGPRALWVYSRQTD